MQHLLQKINRRPDVLFTHVPLEHLGGVTDQLTFRERRLSKRPRLYLLGDNLHIHVRNTKSDALFLQPPMAAAIYIYIYIYNDAHLGNGHLVSLAQIQQK